MTTSERLEKLMDEYEKEAASYARENKFFPLDRSAYRGIISAAHTEENNKAGAREAVLREAMKKIVAEGHVDEDGVVKVVSAIKASEAQS